MVERERRRITPGMGVSTDAILVFGIDFDEEPPWEPFEENDDSEAEKVKNFLGWMAWSGETVDGVKVVEHQSASAPAYIIGIADSIITANRGYPVKVSKTTLQPHEQWAPMLVQFMSKYGISTEDMAPPGWLLCSYWSQ